MPKSFELRSKPLAVIILVTIVIISVICFYYAFYFSNFKKTTATEIHDDILQGLSGLGSVAIAVIIFRVQSLENRNHSLEQTTLNYIQQTMGWSYPEWTTSLENDIRNKTLTDKYYSNVLKSETFILEEKQRQQRRLEESLELHDKVQRTIGRIRNDVFSCAVFLIMPLLLSLVLLMVSDVLNVFWTFFSVSTVVVISSIGIMLLIKMVLASTVK